MGKVTGIILVCRKTGIREQGFLLVWGITVGSMKKYINDVGECCR